MTLTSSTTQAFFCLLLYIPWGSCCPRSCRCTERAAAKAVLCSSQHLQEIPKDIPRDAVLLKLDPNSITSIPSNAFRHLSRLEEISRNAIEKIDGAAFTGLAAGLRSLDLSGSRIRSVPEEALLALRAELRLATAPGTAVRPAGAAAAGDSPRHCGAPCRSGCGWPQPPALRCALQERLRPGSVRGITAPRRRAPSSGAAAAAGAGSGVTLCRASHRSADAAVLVTVFGWFAVVVVCVVCYVRHNRERSCGHRDRRRPQPGPRVCAETTSTAL